MGVVRRARLTEEWRDRAECVGYDPELWSMEDAEEDDIATARYICVEECPVRTDCLRRALRDENPNTFGVMRGGIVFDTSHRVRCYRCGLAVASRRTGICVVCADYNPCLGECGRMVRKDAESWYCVNCKVDEEELIG